MNKRTNKHTDKQTLSSRTIQGAVRIVLPGELAKHAISDGTKAVTKFVAYGGEKTSQSDRAGLSFSVSRTRSMILNKHILKSRNRIGEGAPIYLEFCDGKWELFVWSDINQEDPTHRIDMSGALEANREAST